MDYSSRPYSAALGSSALPSPTRLYSASLGPTRPHSALLGSAWPRFCLNRNACPTPPQPHSTPILATRPHSALLGLTRSYPTPLPTRLLGPTRLDLTSRCCFQLILPPYSALSGPTRPHTRPCSTLGPTRLLGPTALLLSARFVSYACPAPLHLMMRAFGGPRWEGLLPHLA